MHSSLLCRYCAHHHVELLVVTLQSKNAVQAIWIHHMCFTLAALLLQVQTIWVYSMLLHCCFVFTLFGIYSLQRCSCWFRPSRNRACSLAHVASLLL